MLANMTQVSDVAPGPLVYDIQIPEWGKLGPLDILGGIKRLGGESIPCRSVTPAVSPISRSR
jgi:hypothetical protein